jgi:hypothetical protein
MLNKLGALLKYEFRFYFRILPPLYLALILVALMMHFQENSVETDSLLLLFIWGALIITMIVITIAQIIQRFINNFMKDQGSIMFTLPVSIWALLASKAIAALCMVLMSTVTVFVSAFVFNSELRVWMSSMAERINFSASISGEIVLAIFAFIVMIVHQICFLYAVITVSHLLPRFRFIAGCGIYLAVPSFLEQPVFKFIIKNARPSSEANSYTALWFAISDNTYTQVYLSIAALAFAALYFWATGFLLKRTFNLE